MALNLMPAGALDALYGPGRAWAPASAAGAAAAAAASPELLAALGAALAPLRARAPGSFAAAGLAPRRAAAAADAAPPRSATSAAAALRPPPVVYSSKEAAPLSEVLAAAGRRALGGGIPGAAAMAVQVFALMWMRTTVNYQCVSRGCFLFFFSSSRFIAHRFRRFILNPPPTTGRPPAAPGTATA
jgi:hypothetical protein